MGREINISKNMQRKYIFVLDILFPANCVFLPYSLAE